MKQNEIQSIGEILPTIPLLERRSDCDNCGIRPKRIGKKWCNHCIMVYGIENKRDLTRDIQEKIPPRYRSARLQDLNPKLQELYASLDEWDGLLLWGKQGRGKTYAMMAYAIAYLHDRFTVECVNYDMLCSRIRSTYQSGAKETEHDIIKKMCIPSKLFIDDVGVTVSNDNIETDFSLRVFLSIIDQRCNNLRATFISTNKSLEQLEASFDKRISSRLKECCKIIQMTGEDRRGCLQR